MTRNKDLASPPAEATPQTDLTQILARLAAATEVLAQAATQAEVTELRLYTPAEAAPLLGKTENWVIESIQHRRIPFTYIGRSPRLTAAHIRQIAQAGEVKPNKYAGASAA